MWMGVDFYIVVEPNEIGPYQSIYGNRVITGDFDTTTAFFYSCFGIGLMIMQRLKNTGYLMIIFDTSGE